MIGLKSLFLLAACAYGEDVWRSSYEHGTKSGVMICKEDRWLSGVCATNNWRKCQHRGDKKGNMVRCSSVQDGEAKYDFKYIQSSDFGLTIECDVKNGESAIHACSSGYSKACQCSGTTAGSGCKDPKKWVPHQLKCAKGLKLVPHETHHVVTNTPGKQIECPKGYVVYGFCASRMNNSCKDKYGKTRSHFISCVKVAEGIDDKDFTEDYLVTELQGYWEPQLDYNMKHEYWVTEGVETTEGKAMKEEDTRKFGFSQGIELAVSNVAVTGTAKVGFSQDFTKSTSTEVSSSMKHISTEQRRVMCGDDDEDTSHTVWQWFWKTKTESGHFGPVVKTHNFLCAKGTKNSIMTRPRCVPGHCMDGPSSCRVCSYDYCDIITVRNDTMFHFNRSCVDLKLGRDDWGPEHHFGIEYHRGEHIRDGELVKVDTMVLRRDLAFADWTEGDAWGQWADNTAISDWQKGDQFRILYDWEELTSAGTALSALVGLSSALLMMLFAL